MRGERDGRLTQTTGLTVNRAINATTVPPRGPTPEIGPRTQVSGEPFRPQGGAPPSDSQIEDLGPENQIQYRD